MKSKDFAQVEIGCYYHPEGKGKIFDLEYSCGEGKEREDALSSFEKYLHGQMKAKIKKSNPKGIVFVQWEGSVTGDTGRMKAETSFTIDKTEWVMSQKDFSRLDTRLEIQHNKDLKAQNEDDVEE